MSNSTLETLKSNITDFINEYKGRYLSKNALNALLKTFQTKNITIQDWNTLVSYVEQNFSSVEYLGQLMESVTDYVVLKPMEQYITVEDDDYTIAEEDR